MNHRITTHMLTTKSSHNHSGSHLRRPSLFIMQPRLSAPFIATLKTSKSASYIVASVQPNATHCMATQMFVVVQTQRQLKLKAAHQSISFQSFTSITVGKLFELCCLRKSLNICHKYLCGTGT